MAGRGVLIRESEDQALLRSLGLTPNRSKCMISMSATAKQQLCEEQAAHTVNHLVARPLQGDMAARVREAAVC